MRYEPSVVAPSSTLGITPASAPGAGARAILVVLLAGCSHARETPSALGQDAGDAVVSVVDAATPRVLAAPLTPSEPPASCEGAASFFVSPAVPVAGRRVRVMVTSDRPLAGELRVAASESVVTASERRGGPPYFWIAELVAPKSGTYQATFIRNGCPDRTASQSVVIRKEPIASPTPAAEGIWATRGMWTHALENVYSAWIERLFDAPDGEQPSWTALHEVLRDPERNVLYDHLGAKEDSRGPVIRPDCADLPYFLRAYFAWKVGLPFGIAECSRGGRGRPPACHGLLTNEDTDERAESVKKDGAVASFGAFLRGTLADRVHSGSARTPFEDENSDYYPVKLSWESMRPGTVYADPYGHVLLVAKRVAQTAAHGGVLYAVDGQPDGTVARKRFWRGNFLYAKQPALGGPGFKRFRPFVRRPARGEEPVHLARASDEEIHQSKDYGDLSRDAAALDTEGFFDAMDDVLSPRPLDPDQALRETIGALEEQVTTRTKSVDNGRKWLETARSPAPMPEGPAIFETTGAWEDFATPSRDLRLLIAIDVVRGFPARVARRPERFAIPAGSSAKDHEAALSALLERELESRSVTYTRTDGSPQTLTLADVLARGSSYEMAYNPNDCVELRWGARPGTNEAATCRGHAPADQTARMEGYRAWFHDRRRPPRK